MAKKSSKYICNECGYTGFTPFILCPKCKKGMGEEVFEETISSNIISKDKSNKKNVDFSKNYKAKKISKIKDIKNVSNEERIKTGQKTLDKLFGGTEKNYGIMKNSLTLIAGAPGIGKSTLLAQVIDYIQENVGLKTGYISAEENEQQIKNRFDRLGLKGNCDIDRENDIFQIITDFQDHDFLIIDSINTMFIEGAGVIGGVSQIKECTITLMNWAKKYNKTIILVGQINGDGGIAGPQVLEHMVDTVLFFDNYDNNAIYRILKSIKNRFGETNEISIFEMMEKGLKEILNPSLMFIDKDTSKIGSALSIITEGKIPMFIESQSLLVDTSAEKTITQSIGYDSKRIYQLSAIMQKYLKINTYKKNIFVSITGGLKVKNTYLDLSIVCSMLSSLKEKPLDKIIFIGELGLTGEIIKAPYEVELIKQAKNYGFEEVVCNTTGYKHINKILDKFFSGEEE